MRMPYSVVVDGGTAARRESAAGRPADVAAIMAHVERTRAGGHGATVLVEGEAGIGKSTVLSAVTAAATAAGVAVIHASASVLDRARPFGPLLDAFGLDPASVCPGSPGCGGCPTRRAARAVRRATFGDAGVADATRSSRAFAPDRTNRRDGRDLEPRQSGAAGARRPALGRPGDARNARSSAPPDLVAESRARRCLPAGPAQSRAPRPRRCDGERRRRPVRARTPRRRSCPHSRDRRRRSRTGSGTAPERARAGGNPFLVVELVRSLDHEGRIAVTGGVAEIATAVVHGEGCDSRDPRSDPRPHGRPRARVGARAPDRRRPRPSFSVSRRGVDARADRSPALLPLIATAGQRPACSRRTVTRCASATTWCARRSSRPSAVPALAALHLDIARAPRRRRDASAVRVAAHYALGAELGDRTAVEWLRTAAAADRQPRSDVGGRAAASSALDAHPGRRAGARRGRSPSSSTPSSGVATWSSAAALAGTTLARPLPPATAAALHETMARALVVLGRPGEAVAHAERLVELGEHPAWPSALDGRVQALRPRPRRRRRRRTPIASHCATTYDDPWAETLGVLRRVVGGERAGVPSARRRARRPWRCAPPIAHRTPRRTDSCRTCSAGSHWRAPDAQPRRRRRWPTVSNSPSISVRRGRRPSTTTRSP